MSLAYLPRTAWNARTPSKPPRPLQPGPVRGIVLHYPAMGKRHLFAQADVARALRGWQDFHMDDREWSDIAYQIAVDQAGRKWKLRGLTTMSGANGNEELNEQYGAILLVVGDSETPTGALITSTREVIADFRRLNIKANLIKPHSAVRPDGTKCPGDPVRGLIASGQFEPRSEGASEMDQADRDYVDRRMSVYALWLHYRQLGADLTVATAKKDVAAVNVLTHLVREAQKDWEAAAK